MLRPGIGAASEGDDHVVVLRPTCTQEVVDIHDVVVSDTHLDTIRYRIISHDSCPVVALRPFGSLFVSSGNHDRTTSENDDANNDANDHQLPHANARGGYR